MKSNKSNISPTGLCKICPRCKRIGDVFIESSNDDFSFEIRWRSTDQKSVESDKGLTFEQIFSPDFGCGEDGSLE